MNNEVGRYRSNTCCLFYITHKLCVVSEFDRLTSLVFEELQIGSFCTQLDHDRDQSGLLILTFLPIDRNSETNKDIGDVHLDNVLL